MKCRGFCFVCERTCVDFQIRKKVQCSRLLKGVSHEIQRFQRLLVGFLMQKVYITKVFFSCRSLAT